MSSSAALVSSVCLGNGANAQSRWLLAADVFPSFHGFSVQVSFSVDYLGGIPLYIQVADAAGTFVFFTWAPISEPVGQQAFDFGSFDIPYSSPYLPFGHTYVVTIVTSSGERHPLSPTVTFDAPSLPDIVL
jgi:hypothetical protein